MAQQMTIPIDPRRQEQIDRYCALAGINQEKALEEVWDIWEQLIYIPRTDFIEKEKRQRKAWAAFRRQRELVERGDVPEMTMDEIIEEIAKARAERHAKEENS